MLLLIYLCLGLNELDDTVVDGEIDEIQIIKTNILLSLNEFCRVLFYYYNKIKIN